MSEPGPLYQRVKDHILSQIRAGTWAPGARVPSENELVGHFRISRMTANRALNELSADGFLARIPGVGTFVKEPPARSSLMELRNIAEEVRSRGHTYSAVIVTSERVKATQSLAEKFETDVSAPLFHLMLVHRDDGVPVQLEDRYVDPEVVPGFMAQDFERITPTAYLLSVVPADELEHTVEAMMPATAEQRLLDIGRGVPCLALHRRSWSQGRVVTVATLLYPGKRYTLHSRYRVTVEIPSPRLRGEG